MKNIVTDSKYAGKAPADKVAAPQKPVSYMFGGMKKVKSDNSNQKIVNASEL